MPGGVAQKIANTNCSTIVASVNFHIFDRSAGNYHNVPNSSKYNIRNAGNHNVRTVGKYIFQNVGNYNVLKC